jgi:hypothetical protein
MVKKGLGTHPRVRVLPNVKRQAKLRIVTLASVSAS